MRRRATRGAISAYRAIGIPTESCRMIVAIWMVAPAGVTDRTIDARIESSIETLGRTSVGPDAPNGRSMSRAPSRPLR